uniref:Uncharacterized protein n=2 Tax=Pavlovaceae TaxID=418969 RepID=M1K537_DIALT|nr:hypothetical protein H907_pgp106 [Diacronema lutheri]YP_009863745.1 hypothetical protein [Pavlova sp. NIVA-4/92]AGE93724.1 hypothetical protein [Diacronema lutheri]QKE31076.1 hypothetical protein [Pavlova sp. NIVA-4/92]
MRPWWSPYPYLEALPRLPWRDAEALRAIIEAHLRTVDDIYRVDLDQTVASEPQLRSTCQCLQAHLVFLR